MIQSVLRCTALGAALCGVAAAQSFQNNTAQIPSGSVFNGGFTENVDFADVDGDGDRDVVKADGGDCCNQQNRIWMNRGGAQGGTIGWFEDQTSTRFPALLDDSRDVDFVDLDQDGDFDLYISNTSTNSNQSNRWWINMGGAQGGSPGYFQDQTAARWVNIAVNNGTTSFSSIAPSVKLASGGFIDWSCDCVFGDLDNDGDPDIVHTTYGGTFTGEVPSRIFLNDGLGFFEEFNPSHFQLSGSIIANGNPGLWCQGNQQHGTTNTTGATCDIADSPLGVEIGDLDGDLDIDILQGARNEVPRLYVNRLSETGTLIYRDETYARFAQFSDTIGNYEQELGDFDNDADLDLYGLNWPNGFDDCTAKNTGAGAFGTFTVLSGSGSDDNEPDWFDYNNDGRLDAYTSAFVGQNRLYRNNGPTSWSHTNVTSSELPSVFDTSLGADTCDVDQDGDYDVIVANDVDDPERFYKNVNQIADLIAPRVANLEQVANRAAGPTPTAVRVQVYDNASWDVTHYDTAVLEYSWDGGAYWHAAPMRFAGGQIFRGEIRGDLAGTIQYRARVTDEHGNVGLSSTKSYTASGCTGNVFVYCTAGTTTSNCRATIAGTGTPSVSAPSGFTISVATVEGNRSGLIFYGVTGRAENNWGAGTSFMCVAAPTQRTGTQNSGGTDGACDGAFTLDFNDYAATNPGVLGSPFAAGQVIDAQAWFRDPPAPKTTNLSNGLEFTLCP